MVARRIAILFKEEDESKWEELADAYQSIGTDNMVAMAMNRYHDDFISEDRPNIEAYDEEVEGGIQEETEEYILTWEDSIMECLRIYRKLGTS